MDVEDHVGGSAVTSEATLAFREKSVFQMATETIEKDASEDLPDDIEQRDFSMITTELSVSLFVLQGLDFVYAYIDDLLVTISDDAEHKVHLRQLFERLDSFSILINAVKCEFGVPSLIFLGHEVDSGGIKPVPEKVSALSTFPVSTAITNYVASWGW
nr:unnamed protein product [Spirometra erinaceieuropaei]